MVSIDLVIPVRGQADFLPAALESLAQQQVKLNLALCDATPDDSIRRVLQPYSLPFSYLRFAPDGDAGQSASINEGLRALNGDICGWLNADDRLMPGALQKVTAIFLANPEIDILYGQAILQNENGNFLGYFPKLCQDPSALLAGNRIAQPACFFRRRIFEKLEGIKEDLTYTMDWDFWQRAYFLGAKFKKIDDVLAIISLYPNTKTASGQPRRYVEMKALFKDKNFFRKTYRLARIKFADRFGGFLAQREWARLFAHFRTGNEEKLMGYEIETGRVEDSASFVLPAYQSQHLKKLELHFAQPVRIAPHLFFEKQYFSGNLVKAGRSAIYPIDYKVINKILAFDLTVAVKPFFLNSIRFS